MEEEQIIRIRYCFEVNRVPQIDCFYILDLGPVQRIPDGFIKIQKNQVLDCLKRDGIHSAQIAVLKIYSQGSWEPFPDTYLVDNNIFSQESCSRSIDILVREIQDAHSSEEIVLGKRIEASTRIEQLEAEVNLLKKRMDEIEKKSSESPIAPNSAPLKLT